MMTDAFWTPWDLTQTWRNSHVYPHNEGQLWDALLEMFGSYSHRSTTDFLTFLLTQKLHIHDLSHSIIEDIPRKGSFSSCLKAPQNIWRYFLREVMLVPGVPSLSHQCSTRSASNFRCTSLLSPAQHQSVTGVEVNTTPLQNTTLMRERNSFPSKLHRKTLSGPDRHCDSSRLSSAPPRTN